MAFFEKATLKSVLEQLRAGADPNAKDEWGFTPLHFAAAFNDDPDIVSALVDAGANLNARDANRSLRTRPRSRRIAVLP